MGKLFLMTVLNFRPNAGMKFPARLVWIQAGIKLTLDGMNDAEKNSPRPKYRWPWFVLALVVLGIVLTVCWVWLAAKNVEEQRDFGQPLPASTPVK